MDVNSCRVCLQSDKLTSLFNSAEDELIVDILQFCMNVPITRDGMLPEYICKSCLTKLKKSNRLKKQFLKNDEYLKNLLRDSSPYKMEVDIFEEVQVKCEPIVANFDEEDIDDPVQSNPIKQEHSEFLFDSNCADFNSTFVETLKPITSKIPKKVNKSMGTTKPKEPFVLPTNHSCFICDMKFSNNIKKNEHLFQVHEKEPHHACTICSYVFESAKQQDIHMKVHKREPKYFCEFCAKGFIDINSMKKHRQTVHINPEYFDCDQCNIKIKSMSGLRKHKRIIHEGMKFLCDKCDYTTSQKVSLGVHLVKNHGAQAIIKCPDCNNVLNTNANVRKHQERWKGSCVTLYKPRIKNPQCPICNRVFKCRGQELIQHINAHTDNREFICSNCNKGFYSKVLLRSHKKGCMNLRNFKCTMCEKGFNSIQVLKIHERSHTKENPFKCEICPKAFAARKYVYRHQKEIHDYYRPIGKGKKGPVPETLI